MHRLIAAILVAASCARIAQAQNTPPVEAGATLDLEQALSMAGASAPSLDVAKADLRAAAAAHTVAFIVD